MKKIFKVLSFLSFLYSIKCEGYYSIVAPGTVRPFTPYNVAVSVYNIDSASTVKLKLSSASEPSFVGESFTIDVAPETTHLIKFDLQNIPFGQYILSAEGFGGIEFKNQTELYYSDEYESIFVQTDKAVYKPGDLVRFRVLFLDSRLKPKLIENSTKITIEDNEHTTVMQFKVADNLNSGVYENQFQLSDLASLGSWKVQINGKKIMGGTFEVEEYVLPKFEVIVNLPEYIVFPNIMFPVVVKAKYTYGKYVNGEAKVSLMDSDIVVQTKTVPLKGKVVVDMDYTYSSYQRPYFFMPRLQVKAEVTESGTELKNEVLKDVIIYDRKYVIKNIDKPKYMPLNNSFSMTFQVTDNKGTPLQDTCDPLELSLIITDRKTTITAFMGEEFLDKKGMALFKIKSLQHMDKIETSNIVSISARASYKYAHDLNIFLSTRRQLSRRGEIIINVVDENPSLHEDVHVTIETQENMKYFIYQVIAGGNILLTERVNVPDTNEFEFQFTPTAGMAPRSTLFVYFVSDGDLYFAEEEIIFGNQFKNFIKVKLPIESGPSENITLTVSAQPGSYVGLLGVDQSVLLKRTGNDINRDLVMSEQKKYKSHIRYPEANEEVHEEPEHSQIFLKGDRGTRAAKQLEHQYNPGPFPAEYESFRRKIRDYSKPYPGEKSGLVTMTNARFPYWKIEEYWGYRRYPMYKGDAYSNRDMYPMAQSAIYVGSAGMVGAAAAPGMFSSMGFAPGQQLPPPPPPPMRPVIVRKEFPETWLWESIVDIGSGKVSINKTVPDTITSWVVTGFSINREHGLALSIPQKLKVFQSFFIRMNLPYSVINGEVISIPVIVFNYMNEDVEAVVTMFNDDKEFTFTEATNEIDDNPIDVVKRFKKVKVLADSTEIVHFLIRPEKVGKLTLKARAITPIVGDAVEKMLLVKPEGVTKYFNKGFLLEKDFATTFDIDIPVDVVPHSIHIEVSVAGHLLGSTLNNLQGLIRIPFGCGEQNMVNFVPNYLVLEFLEAKKELKLDIQASALKNLQIGYQAELRYRHPDGSFSAFGTSDKGGCTWLTAYVARSLKHAAKYIHIDEKIIKGALEFIVKNQAENGSFPEVGIVVDRKYSTGGDGDLVLTAFTLLSFLDNNSERYGQYENTTKRALNYLVQNQEKSNDVFTMAIIAYVLQIANHKDRNAALDRLLTHAINEGDKMWWSQKSQSSINLYSSADVEITSYALLALLECEDTRNVVPIIKLLLSRQDSTGGFGSTQSTVVGLQALIKYSQKFYSTKTDFIVKFKADNENEITVPIDFENSAYLRIYELSPDVRKVLISTAGEGSALAQVSYQYNVKSTPESIPMFSTRPKLLDGSTAESFKISICSSVIPQVGGPQETSMAVMELNVPSGYVVNKDNLYSLNEISEIKKIETKNDDTVAVFYFDNLSTKELCPTLEANRIHNVAKQKASAVVIYDYYDTDRHTTIFYNSPKSELCNICEGEDCGPGCAKLKE